MDEIAQYVGEDIIDCVVFFFYEEGKGGKHYRRKNKFHCRVAKGKKRLVKLRELRERIW